ncbi:restriction endonuclease subunit S [Lutispora sp.]|uniref:restriction endonuclease subunit S n=1 Tax=Lutispora sp. TaxID=2828727 RepID=UPI00356726CD
MMTNRIPKGWQIAKLKDYCEVFSGQGAPQGDGEYCRDGIPFIKAGNLEDLCRGLLENKIQKVCQDVAERYKLKLFPADTIVFAKSGMSCTKNRIYRLRGACYVVNHLACIVPEGIDAQYLTYYLKNNPPSHLIKDAAYPSIRLTDIQELEINVPPLETQKKVASILEKAEKAIEKRKKADELADKYLQSVFIDMFGDPVTNPKGWEIKSLGCICSKITDGTHKTPKYENIGVRFISAKDIKNGKIDWSNTKYININEHQTLIKRCNPENGDILFTKSGSIGAAAIVDKDFEFSLFESLALIKYDRKFIDGKYLLHFLNNPSIRSKYVASTKGISIKHLHLIDIKQLSIIVPPIEQQQIFVRFVQKIEKLKEKQEKSSQELDSLFKSLMQKAFLGEL